MSDSFVIPIWVLAVHAARAMGRHRDRKEWNVTPRLSLHCALLGCFLVGCADEVARGLGSRVDFEVGESAPYPAGPGVDSILTTGLAGSCTPRRSSMPYAEASALTWAVGTALAVDFFWPDRTDCTPGPSIFTMSCPATNVAIGRLGPDAWISDQRGTSPTTTGVSTVAVGAGQGGFRVVVRDSVFAPDFILTAAQPTSMMFERTSGPFFADTIPGAIDRIDIPVGQDGAFVVTLRGRDGGQLCGPVPAVLHIEGDPVFSIDRIVETDFVNLPYHILSGTTPGVGRMVFDAAGVQGVILVSVQ